MSYHTQFLYLVDPYGRPTELINGVRTLRNLEQFGDPHFTVADPTGGCPALAFEPCKMLSDGSMQAWQPIPANAPWFIEDVSGDSYAYAPDDSLDALGFYITEWTGLDGAHHRRASTPLGRGGVSFGPQYHGARTMKLNVMLLGLTERSLDFLFRWLESILIDCCGGCGESDVWVREMCPGSTATSADLERGLMRMRNVRLVEGPTWEAPPVSDAGCHMRMASFTLMAGDPCMYAVPSSSTSTEMTTAYADTDDQDSFTAASSGTWAGSINQLCVTAAFPEIGRGGAVVSISSPYQVQYGGVAHGIRLPIPDLRIRGYSQPTAFGTDCEPGAGILLGEVQISGAETSGLDIEVDLAARRIRTRDTYHGGDWEDGSWLIKQGVAGRRRWWTFGPKDYARIIVEPLFVGMQSLTAWGALNAWPDGIDSVDEMSVSVSFVHYRGCC